MFKKKKIIEQRIIVELEEIKRTLLQKQKKRNALLQRVVGTLTWMVEDMKVRFDQTGIGGH